MRACSLKVATQGKLPFRTPVPKLSMLSEDTESLILYHSRRSSSSAPCKWLVSPSLFAKGNVILQKLREDIPLGGIYLSDTSTGKLWPYRTFLAFCLVYTVAPYLWSTCVSRYLLAQGYGPSASRPPFLKNHTNSNSHLLDPKTHLGCVSGLEARGLNLQSQAWADIVICLT